MNRGQELAITLYQKAVFEQTGEYPMRGDVFKMIAAMSDEDRAALPELFYGYNRPTLDHVKGVISEAQGIPVDQISDQLAASTLDVTTGQVKVKAGKKTPVLSGRERRAQRRRIARRVLKKMKLER